MQYCQLKREKCERMGIEYEDPLDFSVPQHVEGDPALRERDMELTNQLSLHVLGPLFQSYEAMVAQLQTEVAQTKFLLKTQLEDCQLVVLENEKLRDQLEIAKREHLRLVEENRDHASVVRGNKAKEADGSEATDKAGVASSDEIIDLKNRAHLLSEENQALFQQISVLRSHYDQFNKDHQAKMDEANLKISQFDKLQNELRSAILQRDNFSKTSHFLDKKLSETSAKLGAAEEGRRHDQSELKKTREQLKLMHREFEFYKNLAEKLEFRQTDELTSLNRNVREMNEVDKDQKLKLDLLEQDKRELIQQNKVLMADLQKMQRDLKAILAVNEEYQIQTNQMKEREH